jgi:hypothetical protein
MATRGAVNLLGMGVLAWDRTALGDEAIRTCPCACFVSDRLTSSTRTSQETSFSRRIAWSPLILKAGGSESGLHKYHHVLRR